MPQQTLVVRSLKKVYVTSMTKQTWNQSSLLDWRKVKSRGWEKTALFAFDLRNLRLRLKASDPLTISPVIWLRTPKCASSSVLRALESVGKVVNYTKNPNVELGDEVLEKKIICVGAAIKEQFISKYPKIWESSFRFAIVRDPYHRVISAWRYLELLRDRSIEDVLSDPPSASSNRQEFNHFWNPLSEMLSINGALVVNTVLRVETLSIELPTLFDRLGISYPGLPYVNKGPRHEASLNEALSIKAKDMIKARFKDDFEKFRYAP